MLHFLVWAMLAALRPKALLVAKKSVLTAAVAGAAARARIQRPVENSKATEPKG